MRSIGSLRSKTAQEDGVSYTVWREAQTAWHRRRAVDGLDMDRWCGVLAKGIRTCRDAGACAKGKVSWADQRREKGPNAAAPPPRRAPAWGRNPRHVLLPSTCSAPAARAHLPPSAPEQWFHPFHDVVIVFELVSTFTFGGVLQYRNWGWVGGMGVLRVCS